MAVAPRPAPVAVEVVYRLKDYTEPQLIHAVAIWRCLNRGVLVLCEPPWDR